MFQFDVTPELLVVVVAGVLAFVFDYVPVVKDWFDKLLEHQKKQFMFGMLFLEVAVIFAGVCFGVFVTGVLCDVPGAVELLGYLFVAVGVNQGVHALTKPGARG